MTAPAPSGPDGLTPELLAAYADGELDPVTRARVERWLAAHPGAREELRAQRRLSPGNVRLWEQIEPPAPPEDTWTAVRRAVEEAVLPARVATARFRPGRWRRVGLWVAGGLAASAAAASVGWWLATPAAPRPSPAEPPGRPPAEVATASHPDDPLAGLTVLPMATAADVELLHVPADAAEWLPVARVLLPDAVVLAGPEDVLLEGADANDPAWPPGGPKMLTAPGDAPMIYGARPR
jgi:anti-sigma factor RsiW